METYHQTKAKNMNSSQFKRSADELQQGKIKKQRVDVEGNPFSRWFFALKLSGYKSSYFNNISNASWKALYVSIIISLMYLL